MLERAFATTVRNLSTLFLLGAIVFVPLHLGHAFLFRNVLSVHELRGDIQAFPEGKKVRGVGASQLEDERTTLMILLAAEAGLSFVLLGAARRVAEVDAEGGVPTVVDALEHAGSHLRTTDLRRLWTTPVLLGLLVGTVTGWLVYRIGAAGTELLGNDKAFVGIGLTRGAALAMFVTFIVGPASVAPAKTSGESQRPLDLY